MAGWIAPPAAAILDNSSEFVVVGPLRWTTTNVNRIGLRVTDGDVVSNTVIVPAR